MHHCRSTRWEFKLAKTMWMCKHGTNRRVFPHAVSAHLHDGWRFGRNLKHLEDLRDNCGEKIWVYNEESNITKRISQESLDSWKSVGWTEGRGPNLMSKPNSRCTGRIWISQPQVSQNKPYLSLGCHLGEQCGPSPLHIPLYSQNRVFLHV